jgi:RNA polymerase sigma-70 factor (ECF subfamily)
MALGNGADRLSGTDVPAGQPAPDVEFDAIYRAEVPSLLRFFRRRLGSHEEADDLAHEALTRFLRASPATQIATPQAYLKRIAINLLRDRAERASTKLSELSVPLVEGLDYPTEYDQHRQLEGRQELDHYTTVLRQLKPKTLEIFLLSRVDGFTYKEIAAKIGMSVWGVKRQMLKAIAHIDQHRRTR